MGKQANAVILAAGKSNRFAPFTYEKPKGLFRVKGEILIERQIEQLLEAGIKDIYIVVGFMKEKYFYLERKYGVHLLVNNRFDKKGNVLSVYAAKEHLKNTYICCADQYFVNNPFLDTKEYSYRTCAYKQGKFREFKVAISNEGVITDFEVGGEDDYCMVGQAYFTESFSKKFIELLEREVGDFGVDGLFWEEYYARHVKSLTLYAELEQDNQIFEFDSVEELRQFDQDFLNNIDSNIVKNICSILKCQPNDIERIEIIQKGLTNVSFAFWVGDTQYVYRHPGGTAGNLVDRETELYAQYLAKDLGIDKSVIHMDRAGWKISYCVQDLVPCDFDKNPDQLKKAMEYLRMLHSVEYKPVKEFDMFEEALKLMRIASATKGDLEAEFAELIEKIGRLNEYAKADGVPKVLCHNDIYAPNFLITKAGEMYLIDWEYAGINDPANDVTGLLSRYYYTDEEIDYYLRAYFGRELTPEEHRHYMAYVVINGFYFFCWGLYKGSVGEEDGFFFLQTYRNCYRFVDAVLAEYEAVEK